jgi:hypothetical protein
MDGGERLYCCSETYAMVVVVVLVLVLVLVLVVVVRSAVGSFPKFRVVNS